MGKCVYDAYAHIPTTYIVCTEDEILPVDFQQGRIEFLHGQGVEVDVRTMKTGHCPNVSALEETAEVVVRAIEGREAAK
jgi:predicted esterase